MGKKIKQAQVKNREETMIENPQTAESFAKLSGGTNQPLEIADVDSMLETDTIGSVVKKVSLLVQDQSTQISQQKVLIVELMKKNRSLSTQVDENMQEIERLKQTAQIQANAQKNAVEISEKLPEVVADLWKDREEAQRRSRNVVVIGVKETEQNQSEGTMMAKDLAEMKKIMTALDIKEAKIVGVRRLGRKVNGRNRPLQVIFDDANIPNQVLRKSKELKGIEELADVYVNRDLTRKQREKEYKLRQELRQRRADGEQVRLWHGKVIKSRI